VKTRRTWGMGIALLAFLLTIACGGTSTSNADWQTPLKALLTLHATQHNAPRHLLDGEQRREEDFDPNTYFTALERLSLEPGYVLDYVYYADFLGGAPVLYARATDQPPYSSESALPRTLPPYLDSIHAEDSIEGFYQLALLRVLGGQFYLYWHAGYNDRQVLVTPAAITALLEAGDGFEQAFPHDMHREAQNLNPTPQVVLNETTVTVTLLTFTNWGGFEQYTVTFQRAFPHTRIEETIKTLVEYDCGVVF